LVTYITCNKLERTINNFKRKKKVTMILSVVVLTIVAFLLYHFVYDFFLLRLRNISPANKAILVTGTNNFEAQFIILQEQEVALV
jgi:hypothetical protein